MKVRKLDNDSDELRKLNEREEKRRKAFQISLNLTPEYIQNFNSGVSYKIQEREAANEKAVREELKKDNFER